jgi:hypothetical protein
MGLIVKPGFSRGNSYLFSRDVYTWNLPSGHTCPGAWACLAYADRETGRITKGKHSEFKCYSAVTERFPAVRAKSWSNYELVRFQEPQTIADLLCALLPKRAELIRIHAAGDFFSQPYFDAWLEVCRREPGRRFWAFTKSIRYWLARINDVPPNLNMRASLGSKHDDLIIEHGLKYARVVYSPQEAERLNLRIDSDDSLAAFGNEPFALLENFTRPRNLPMLEL